MKYKVWTIEFVTNEGKSKFAPTIVSMSITDAIEHVCRTEGIDANQITYASGKEADLL